MDKYLIRSTPQSNIPSKYKKETWLNIYGREYRDLLIIDVDENVEVVEFKKTIDEQISALVELDPEKEMSFLLTGLHSLRAIITGGEYPSIDLTTAVFLLLKKGTEKDIDSSITMEAFDIASQLLRLFLPSNGDFRRYWKFVLLKLLGGNFSDAHPLQIRDRFVTALSKVVNFEGKTKNQLMSIAAYLKIICELLEIDFAEILEKNFRNSCSYVMIQPTAPLIAAIFWPYRQVQIGELQEDVLKPIVKGLVSTEDLNIHDACSRLMAMFFEMIRLAYNDETPSLVTFTNTPQKLRQLIDLPCISNQRNLECLHDSIAFGWFKEAVNERKTKANGMKNGH